MKRLNNKGFGLVEIIRIIATAMCLSAILFPPLVRYYEKVTSEQNVNTIIEVPSDENKTVVVRGNAKYSIDEKDSVITITIED